MSNDAGYLRHPTIHGDTIVFACEDDLWRVSAAGGTARRLTANPGTASFPVLSPDGKRVAFTSRDEGPPEAWVVDADGGTPTRLTWFGATTATVGWTPAGEVVVATDASQPFRGYAHLHAVPANGGPPRPLRLGPARAVSFEAGGKGVVIGRNSGDPARWKRYRGGTAGTLWIDRRGDGDFAALASLPGNLACPMWVAGRVWFLSDHEGHGNLYSCAPDGSGITRHTHHEDFYVRWPSTDGRRIVYHAGADVFVYDPKAGRGGKVDIRLGSSRPQRARRFVPAAKHLESFDPHPKGHSVAVVVRGGVHAMPLFEGAATRPGATSGVRRRLARWLPDGKRLVAVTDEGGEESLVVLTADGSEAPRLVPGDFGRPLDLVVAPAGADRVAIANQRHEVIVVSLGNGAARVLERSAFERIEGLAWSADGRWLAYGFPSSRRTCAIHLAEADSGRVVAATRSDFRDGYPSFDPAGRWLAFVSARVYDPVYDAHYFDLGFPKGTRPCLLTLRADVVSPFATGTLPPRAPGVTLVEATASQGDAPGEKAPGEKASGEKPADAGAKSATPPPPEVRVDVEGIEDRVVALPVPEGRYAAVRAVSGRILFSSFPSEGSLGADWRVGGEPDAKGHLQAYDFDAEKVVDVVHGMTSFETSLDGKSAIVRSGNRLRAIPAGTKSADLSPKDEPGRETGYLDLDRLRVSVVPGDEWRQMYREAWRLQRDQFWTSDMSGVDWQAIHDRYLALVERVAVRSEFSDLLWEMQGELGTSHCYEMGGDYRPEPAWHLGHLGADLALDAESGAWTVARIPRGDSWDPSRAAPLSAPGVLVRAGDAIVAVDGEPVGADAPPGARLLDRAGRDVRLTVRDAKGTERTVVVRTLRDEQPLRYRDWVEANRAKVHAVSKGRLGYVHVPNMGPLGYSEFHRYFGSEVDNAGLVIDVRWNGGGHVSQLLLEKLLRRRLGYNANRWGPALPYPDDAPMGPMVALTNEYAGSDGDIFSHCFKLSGLGPLVGKRTWGGVVGIWPRHALVDGTLTTQPEFAFWFRDVGFGVEGHGTDPDVEVEIRPQDHAKGADPQLDRAIAEALALVEKAAGGVPDLAAKRPSRRPPRLERPPA